MRKKYLSRILLGGLLVASTVAITSCKDYDDDIDDLQSQITSLSSSISALQSATDDNTYVSSYSYSNGVITLVMSGTNAGTYTVDISDLECDCQIVTVEDGVLYIGGVAQELATSSSSDTEEAEAVYATGVDGSTGTWVVTYSDGTTLDTGVIVDAVTLSGSDTEGYVLTVTDSEGNVTEVELPSAASSLTDLKVQTDYYAAYTDELLLAEYTFSYTNGAGSWDTSVTGKELPEDGAVIIANDQEILIQINPTYVDPDDLNLYLVSSQNAKADDIDLVATPYSELVLKSVSDNGLYTLGIDEDLVLAAGTSYFDQFMDSSGTSYIAYAVTAGGSVRSDYVVKVDAGTAGSITNITFGDEDHTVDDTTTATGVTTYVEATGDNTVMLELGTYYFEFDDEDALYDSYVEVDDADATLFGITVINNGGSDTGLTITKTTDQITKTYFDATVYTVDKNGYTTTTTIRIYQSTQLGDVYTYATQYHTIQTDASDANLFGVSLDEMFTALGTDNSALWVKGATTATVTLTDANGNDVSGQGITVYFEDDAQTLVSSLSGTTVSGSSTSYVYFGVVNATASTATITDATTGNTINAFTIGDTYTATIVFTNSDGNTLNTIVIPFVLELPDLSEVFTFDSSAYDSTLDSYVIYLDINDRIYTTAGSTAASTEIGAGLYRIFETWDSGYEIGFQDVTTLTIGSSSYVASGVAYLYDTTNSAAGASAETDDMYDGTNGTCLAGIYLKDVDGDGTYGDAYGLPLDLYIGGDYDGWTYSSDDQLKFNLTILSPIAEGTVEAVSSAVTVQASDLTTGAQIDDDDIVAYTYNKKAGSYSICKSDDGNGNLVYERADISSITFDLGTSSYLTSYSENDGYYTLFGTNVYSTVSTTITVTITDIWGFSTEPQEITVTVNVN